MLGTIVIEKYKKTENKDILNALNELIIENSNDWATAGLYCYWDYYTKEILYVGLAVDLVERFRQHNGFSKCNKNSCKFKEIEEYFENNEFLGFSIVIQSALSQPVNQRQRKKYRKSFNDFELKAILGEQGHDEIKRLEGKILEAFRQKYDRFPLWNKMGGSIIGQKSLKENQFEILELLVATKDNGNVTRVSLKDLASNSIFCMYEAYLHSLRISPLSLSETIKMHKNTFNIFTIDEICKNNYLRKKPNI